MPVIDAVNANAISSRGEKVMHCPTYIHPCETYWNVFDSFYAA